MTLGLLFQKEKEKKNWLSRYIYYKLCLSGKEHSLISSVVHHFPDTFKVSKEGCSDWLVLKNGESLLAESNF